MEVEVGEGSRGDSSPGPDPAVTQGMQLRQVKRGVHGSDAIRRTQMRKTDGRTDGVSNDDRQEVDDTVVGRL